MNEEEFKEFIKKAHEVRGSILNESIFLEKMLNYFIATHYCGDTEIRDEMCNNFLEFDVSFRAKVACFGRIMKENYKSWLSEHNKIPEYLTKICDLRNAISHQVLDTSKYGRQQFLLFKEINLTHFNKIERIVFSQEYVEDIMNVITYTTNNIMLLLPGFQARPFPSGQ